MNTYLGNSAGAGCTRLEHRQTSYCTAQGENPEKCSEEAVLGNGGAQGSVLEGALVVSPSIGRGEKAPNPTLAALVRKCPFY